MASKKADHASSCSLVEGEDIARKRKVSVRTGAPRVSRIAHASHALILHDETRMEVGHERAGGQQEPVRSAGRDRGGACSGAWANRTSGRNGKDGKKERRRWVGTRGFLQRVTSAGMLWMIPWAAHWDS